MAQNPEDLEVFVEARNFADDVLKLLTSARVPNRFEDQVFGSITSVPANLAEFCAFSQNGAKLEKLHRCIAETNETEYWLSLWMKHYGLSNIEHEKLRSKNEIVRKKLFKLRQHILSANSEMRK